MNFEILILYIVQKLKFCTEFKKNYGEDINPDKQNDENTERLFLAFLSKQKKNMAYINIVSLLVRVFAYFWFQASFSNSSVIYLR